MNSLLILGFLFGSSPGILLIIKEIRKENRIAKRMKDVINKDKQV